jgi:hypothetical protein
MDAKQRRRRFAQNCRSSVYRVHAKALAGGMKNPIVLALDLRDRLACEFALSVMTPEKLAKKIAVDTRNDLAPLLVFPMPSDEAAALVGGRSSKAGELLRGAAARSRFRLVIVGHGGLTCTCFRVAKKVKLAGDRGKA